MSECKTETINLIPDHVSGMRLAVMLAARGVNRDGLAGLVAEAERVGRMADAFAALVTALRSEYGHSDTCDVGWLLSWCSDDLKLDPAQTSTDAVAAALAACAGALTATD